jgi:hypothetical protein
VEVGLGQYLPLEEDEIAIAKLNKYKYRGRDRIPAKLFKQEGKYYVLRSINSLITFGIRKNCLTRGRSLLFYQFMERVIKPTIVII